MFMNTQTVKLDESKKDFELLPKGWYRVMVSDSSGKETKDGSGYYLALTYTVIEGNYKARKIWNNYNIRNKNEKAVAIALQELKALCLATDNDRPFEQEFEFHSAIMDKTLYVKLGHRTDKRDNEARTVILEYKKDVNEGIHNTASIVSGGHKPEIPNMDIPF